MSISSIDSEIRKTALKLQQSGADKKAIARKLKELFKSLNIENKAEIVKSIKQDFAWINDHTMKPDIRDLVATVFQDITKEFIKADKNLNKQVTDIVNQMSKKDFTRAEFKNVLESVVGRQKGWANTISRTATGGFDSLTRVKDLEDDYVAEYVGPSAERSFCIDNLGKERKISEWKSMKNDMGQSVIIYRGGYNCKHQIV